MAVTWYEVLEPLPVKSYRVLFSHGGTVWQVSPFKMPNKTHLHPRCILECTYLVITQALGPNFQFTEYMWEEIKQRQTIWRSNQTDTEPENVCTVLDIKIPKQCIMHNAYSWPGSWFPGKSEYGLSITYDEIYHQRRRLLKEIRQS